MAADFHFRALNLPVGRNSFVKWAKQPAGQAIVFVNGFGGSPQKTWPDFPDLLAERSECAESDLIFYGYHSFKARVAASANEFSSFMQTLCARPAVLINETLRPELRRPSTFQYSSVIIVAHSLGAVIARQALLDLDEGPRKKWLDKLSLVLFAPAHMGADLVPLGSEFLKDNFSCSCSDFSQSVSACLARSAARFQDYQDLEHADFSRTAKRNTTRQSYRTFDREESHFWGAR